VGYEYDLDCRVIAVAGWDVVTLPEWEDYLAAAAALPSDLRGAIEYVDLSEAFAIRMNEVGALQLALWYEGLLQRGLEGTAICAPNEAVYRTAGMIVSTCARLGGGLPGGYRLTRHPLRLRGVRRFLSEGPEATPMVA